MSVEQTGSSESEKMTSVQICNVHSINLNDGLHWCCEAEMNDTRKGPMFDSQRPI